MSKLRRPLATNFAALALLHPGYVSGLWYSTWEGSTGTSNAVAAANLLYLHAFRIWRPVRLAQLAMRCATGGAGSSVKMAIWRNNYGTGRPAGTPVAGSNSGQATTATATASVDITDVDLVPGVYWGAGVFTGTLPTMSHLATSALGAHLSGASSNTNAVSSQHLGLSAPMTYTDDIMATDLSAATFTPVSVSSGLPALAFLVA